MIWALRVLALLVWAPNFGVDQSAEAFLMPRPRVLRGTSHGTMTQLFPKRDTDRGAHRNRFKVRPAQLLMSLNVPYQSEQLNTLTRGLGQLSTAHGWCLTPQDEQNLARYQGALHRATTYLSATAQKRVDVALEVAYQAHLGQVRKSGAPYVEHPLSVAIILAHLRLDDDCLCAGLLHDTVEDTRLSFADVEAVFGRAVRKLVEGETKVSKLAQWSAEERASPTAASAIPSSRVVDDPDAANHVTGPSIHHNTMVDQQQRSAKESAVKPHARSSALNRTAKTTAATNGNNINNSNDYDSEQLANLQQLLIAMSQDWRVLMIKLADRLHNMRTLHAMPLRKQQRIARETLEVFAPLARRVGVWAIKEELEDRSFAILDPEAFRAVEKALRARRRALQFPARSRERGDSKSSSSSSSRSRSNDSCDIKRNDGSRRAENGDDVGPLSLRAECARLQLQLAQAPGGLGNQVAWVRVKVRSKGVYNTWRSMNRHCGTSASFTAPDTESNAASIDGYSNGSGRNVEGTSVHEVISEVEGIGVRSGDMAAAVADAITFQVIFDLKLNHGGSRGSSNSHGDKDSACGARGSAYSGDASSAGRTTTASTTTTYNGDKKKFEELPREVAAAADEVFAAPSWSTSSEEAKNVVVDPSTQQQHQRWAAVAAAAATEAAEAGLHELMEDDLFDYLLRLEGLEGRYGSILRPAGIAAGLWEDSSDDEDDDDDDDDDGLNNYRDVYGMKSDYFRGFSLDDNVDLGEFGVHDDDNEVDDDDNATAQKLLGRFFSRGGEAYYDSSIGRAPAGGDLVDGMIQNPNGNNEGGVDNEDVVNNDDDNDIYGDVFGGYLYDACAGEVFQEENGAESCDRSSSGSSTAAVRLDLNKPRFVSEAALDTSALDETLQLAIDLNGYDTSDAGTETTTELATRAAKVSTGRRAQGKIKEGDPERFFASAAEDTTDNEGEIDSTELDHELWCYAMLEAVHNLYRPVHPPRVKDYVAFPKLNGYQGLHTVVNLPGRAEPIEVQVRTASMESVALFGLAATWRQTVAAAATTRRAKSRMKGARTTSSAPTDTLEEEEENGDVFGLPWLRGLPEIGISPLVYLPPVPDADHDDYSLQNDENNVNKGNEGKNGIRVRKSSEGEPSGAGDLTQLLLSKIATDRRFVRTPQGTILNLRPDAAVRDAVAELLLRGGYSPWLAAMGDDCDAINAYGSSGSMRNSADQLGAIDNGEGVDSFSSSGSGENRIETQPAWSLALPSFSNAGATYALPDGGRRPLFGQSTRSTSGKKASLRILATKVNGRPASMDRKLRDGDLVTMSTTSLDSVDPENPGTIIGAPWEFSTCNTDDSDSSSCTIGRGSRSTASRSDGGSGRRRAHASFSSGSGEGLSLGLVAIGDSTCSRSDRGCGTSSSASSSTNRSKGSRKSFTGAFASATSAPGAATALSTAAAAAAVVNTGDFGATSSAFDSTSSSSDVRTTSNYGAALPNLPEWRLPSFLSAEVLEACGIKGPLVPTPLEFLSAVEQKHGAVALLFLVTWAASHSSHTLSTVAHITSAAFISSFHTALKHIPHHFNREVIASSGSHYMVGAAAGGVGEAGYTGLAAGTTTANLAVIAPPTATMSTADAAAAAATETLRAEVVVEAAAVVAAEKYDASSSSASLDFLWAMAVIETLAQLLWITAPKHVPFLWGGPLGQTPYHYRVVTNEVGEVREQIIGNEGSEGRVSPSSDNSYIPTQPARNDHDFGSSSCEVAATLDAYDRARLERSLNEHANAETSTAEYLADSSLLQGLKPGFGRKSDSKISIIGSAIDESSSSYSITKLRTAEITSGDRNVNGADTKAAATMIQVATVTSSTSEEVASVLPALTPKANALVVAGRIAMVAFWVILAASGYLNRPLF